MTGKTKIKKINSASYTSMFIAHGTHKLREGNVWRHLYYLVEWLSWEHPTVFRSLQIQVVTAPGKKQSNNWYHVDNATPHPSDLPPWWHKILSKRILEYNKRLLEQNRTKWVTSTFPVFLHVAEKGRGGLFRLLMREYHCKISIAQWRKLAQKTTERVLPSTITLYLSPS